MTKNVMIVTNSGVSIDLQGVELTEIVDDLGNRNIIVWDKNKDVVVGEFYNPDAVLNLDYEQGYTANDELSELGNEEQADEFSSTPTGSR